jgi:OOP family OmpA-OmpF porin
MLAFRRLPVTLLPVLLASLPALAAAQTQPSVDLRTWRPSMAPEAGLVLEPIQSPGPWHWNIGAWLNYTHMPVVLRDASTGNVALEPLAHVLGADLVAGVGLGDRAAVGVDVPLFLWQDGASGLPPTIVSGGKVPTAGVGDIAILGKGTIIRNDPHGVPLGFGVAALGAVTLPTGERTSFESDGSTTVSLRFLAEYALGIAALRASLGYTLRTAQQTWPDSSLGGVTFGDELPWSVGATLRPKGAFPSLDADDRQSWELALHGALPASPVAPFQSGASSLSPVLVALDDRIAFGHYRDAFVLAGGEVGLDRAAGVPAFRIVLGIGWAPRPHDRDGDGIPDDVDECPDLAEDFDGIQDQDGCPEDDADGDGVLDAQDACPLVPGVWWNDPKKNGCPAPDSDGDGVPDPVDACPAVKGVASDDPKKNGCPTAAQDRDRDGIPDDADKCPDQPEDVDGFEDFDGCPDLDDDGDGIPDKEDACPRVKGVPSTDPARNGCPDPDRDGDTYDDDVDKCPTQAEVFNGVKDDDGCPDEGGKPLVVIDVFKGTVMVRIAQPILFTGANDTLAIDPRSATTLRALAQEVKRRPDWTLAVGARPGPGKPEEAQQTSMQRALLVANRIATYTHRPGSAEVVGWDAVRQQTGASSSVGFAILATTAEKPSAPLLEKQK